MSTRQHDDGTLGSGRNWASQPLDGGPITWTVDPAGGCIQGPLDLGFLVGQRMALVLEEGQQALLVDDGRLRAVYLDGSHCLEIGTGRGQVAPSCRLFFLALGAALTATWDRKDPVLPGGGGVSPVTGSCALRIGWPSRFFRTFLHGLDAPETGFVEGLVAQHVRGLCELALRDIPAERRDPTLLGPTELAGGLEACGLVCTHLSLGHAGVREEAEAAAARETSTVQAH